MALLELDASLLTSYFVVSFCNYLSLFSTMNYLIFLSTATRSLSSNYSRSNRSSTSFYISMLTSSSFEALASYLFLNFVIIKFLSCSLFLFFLCWLSYSVLASTTGLVSFSLLIAGRSSSVVCSMFSY